MLRDEQGSFILLGKGANGAVYEAKMHSEQEVAVKVGGWVGERWTAGRLGFQLAQPALLSTSTMVVTAEHR